MGEKFNENLRQIREKRGFSQKEMSEQLDVARSTYSLYESGNREPNIQTIKKIACILNISTDILLGVDTTTPPVVINLNLNDYTADQWKRIESFARFIKHEEAQYGI